MSTQTTKPRVQLEFYSKLINVNELPPWMRKDLYIRRGYRAPQKSIRGCYNSLWYLHNETVNIWSHLLMGLFMMGLLTWSSIPALHNGYEFSADDMGVLQFYLVCNMGCLFFSAFYHCACCHSELVAQRCLKLDYMGITLCITSTGTSAAYFALYDDRRLARVYIAFILALGGLTFKAVLDPGADGPHKAFWRSVVFIALGSSGFLPIIHAYLFHKLANIEYPFANFAGGAMLYVLGAVIYVRRIPEKYRPEIFDTWGASHQIFHIVVNIGQISHLWGLKMALLQRYT